MKCSQWTVNLAAMWMLSFVPISLLLLQLVAVQGEIETTDDNIDIDEKYEVHLNCHYFCLTNCLDIGHAECHHRCDNGCGCVNALLVLNSEGHRHIRTCRGDDPSEEDVDPVGQEGPEIDNSNDDYRVNIIEYVPAYAKAKKHWRHTKQLK